MTNHERSEIASQITEAFNIQIAKEKDSGRIAKLEILREYFTNPEFRKAMEDIIFEINNN